MIELSSEAKAVWEAIQRLPKEQIAVLKKKFETLSDDLEFRAWMVQVDYHMGTIVPLTHKDLDQDCPYQDWHNLSIPPYDAATMALKDSGYDLEGCE